MGINPSPLIQTARQTDDCPELCKPDGGVGPALRTTVVSISQGASHLDQRTGQTFIDPHSVSSISCTHKKNICREITIVKSLILVFVSKRKDTVFFSRPCQKKSNSPSLSNINSNDCLPDDWFVTWFAGVISSWFSFLSTNSFNNCLKWTLDIGVLNILYIYFVLNIEILYILNHSECNSS